MSVYKMSQAHLERYADVISSLQERHITARDGVRIAYQIIGSGPQYVMLANGLGGRLYSWLPIIAALAERYTFITWDYRGLFESSEPENRAHMGVPDHAEDLLEILEAEKIQGPVHLIGWSMGVQVSLQFALEHPARVASLCLVNGTYGQIFDTALQPFVRIPISNTRMHRLFERVQQSAGKLDWVGKIFRAEVHAAFWLRKRLIRKKHSTLTLGMRQYVNDVTQTRVENFLHLFQQLDAHSVYHLLPEVKAPTLVISGGLDYLTPAYQSREIARRIPGAKHLSIPFATHFVLLERPERVVGAIADHLLEA